MHYKEFDFRSEPLRFLCTATENAIIELVTLTNPPVNLDVITAMEIAEYQYGAVYVAWQAYAVGTVSDINEIRLSLGKDKRGKLDLYKQKQTVSEGPTSVELINALANYFKHHEEWSAWPSNHTTDTLRCFGINEKTEFPLSHGVEVLEGDNKELRKVCEILEGWRSSLISEFNENA